jgi:hypothetical protein
MYGPGKEYLFQFQFLWVQGNTTGSCSECFILRFLCQVFMIGYFVCNVLMLPCLLENWCFLACWKTDASFVAPRAGDKSKSKISWNCLGNLRNLSERPVQTCPQIFHMRMIQVVENFVCQVLIWNWTLSITEVHVSFMYVESFDQVALYSQDPV